MPLHCVSSCGAASAVSLRLFRDRGGERCAVGFTSVERLTTVLGPQQRYYRLSERSVRVLARERGVTALVVDPGMVAAPVHEPVHDQSVRVPRRIEVLRAAWSGPSAGVLTVSALTGVAAVAMEVLK
jgi:hypothetical protein